MKKYSSIILVLLFAVFANAQTEDRALKISLQTDLIAYTTPGGWSAWLAIQHHQNKLSFAYVNFPNRYGDYYDESALQELDQFFRIQYARYFKPDSKFKDFYLGANMEYHLRTLEEDNNTATLEETGFKIAPIVGYEWHPWTSKENALSNLSLALWAGPTFLIGYDDELVFENTGSIYEPRENVEVSVGVLVSYTIFKNYK